MVGIREHVGFVEFKPLTNEVHDLVDENGPLSVSKIKAVLSDRRKILSVTINMILDGSDEIVKVAPGMYDTIINVFGTRALYEHLKIAIRINLLGHINQCLTHHSFQKHLVFQQSIPQPPRLQVQNRFGCVPYV